MRKIQMQSLQFCQCLQGKQNMHNAFIMNFPVFREREFQSFYIPTDIFQEGSETNQIFFFQIHAIEFQSSILR